MSEGKSSTTIAFQYPDFLSYFVARVLNHCGLQILVVGLSQFVYEKTRDPLQLGYIGFALFLPRFLLALFAGQSADLYRKKTVILTAGTLKWFAILGILFFVIAPHASLNQLYLLLFVVGAATIFEDSAGQALVPQLVSDEDFTNAVTWASSAKQIAMIVGPSFAGFLYAFANIRVLVSLVLCVSAVAWISLFLIKHSEQATKQTQRNWQFLVAGLKYVFEKKLLLGVMSLDLFAVLLGGVVALLPIFANEVLRVGPLGYGFLRAGVPMGAALMTLVIGKLNRTENIGAKMLVCVGLFGIFTILFAASRNFYFSMLCLLIMGATDMVSMVIRGVLVQKETPPEMRGRVSAVNMIFIGASNELGEFESGVTARFLGTVPAAVLGGIGTLAVVLLWSQIFPEIKKIKTLI